MGRQFSLSPLIFNHNYSTSASNHFPYPFPLNRTFSITEPGTAHPACTHTLAPNLSSFTPPTCMLEQSSHAIIQGMVTRVYPCWDLSNSTKHCQWGKGWGGESSFMNSSVSAWLRLECQGHDWPLHKQTSALLEVELPLVTDLENCQELSVRQQCLISFLHLYF